MNKNLENYVSCPKCKANISRSENQSYVCSLCKEKFINYNEIIDFRDIKKHTTKGFSIEKDLEISKILLKIFNKVKTFNGLLFFYEKIETYQNLKSISDEKTKEILIESLKFDKPMTKEQSIHGYDILKKVDLYKEEFYYDDYQKNVCLENGGGHGLFTEGLSKNFNVLLVIDFSMSYLTLVKKLCEEKNLLNVFLICANVEKLPIKEKSIDFIHSNNVIEHVTNQDSMISEISRVLSNKGLLFLLSPNKNSAYYEPHFRIPFYGFVPFKLRYWLIYKLQNRDCRDVSLLNFKELKKIFNENFQGKSNITFIPSKLKKTAQPGYIRKIIIFFLSNKLFGSLFSIIINKILIGIMPYHVIIAKKK